MTLIVARRTADGIELAGDRRISFDNGDSVVGPTKLEVLKEGMALGAAGSTSDEPILWELGRALKRRRTSRGVGECLHAHARKLKSLHLIVVAYGEIWVVEGPTVIYQTDTYAAIGSGSHVAIGALAAEASLERVFRITAEHDTSVSDTFDLEVLHYRA